MKMNNEEMFVRKNGGDADCSGSGICDADSCGAGTCGSGVTGVEKVSGVYETMRSFKGVFALLDEHKRRLDYSCSAIGVSFPDLEKIVSDFEDMHSVLVGKDVRLRISVDRSGNVDVCDFDLPLWQGSFLYNEIWPVKIFHGVRENASLKSTDTEMQARARKLAKKEGYGEVLLVDENAKICEGSITNVFFVEGERIVTPGARMLPGISRGLIIKACEDLGIDLRVEDVYADDFSAGRFDSFFLSNSIRGIIPTSENISPITRRVADRCTDFINDLIEERMSRLDCSSRKREVFKREEAVFGERKSKKKETVFMGVLNVTPDSFSDGGRFIKKSVGEDFDFSMVADVAEQMLLDGARVLDIGGESTGPGSVDVSLEEELARVVPAVKAVRKRLFDLEMQGKFPGIRDCVLSDVSISVDTWKSEVARAALDAGAEIINDVTAGRGDERIFEVAARAKAKMILMYSKNEGPRTDNAFVHYDDVLETIKTFLNERVKIARNYGVEDIILDPGMGAFLSADPAYSYEVLDRIDEFCAFASDLGCSVLVGASRKSFLGEDKLGGTLAITRMLRGKVDYLRVHDVFENATVL